MKKIIVDKEDEYLLTKYSWWLKDGKYPQTQIKKKHIYLHQLILKTNQLVDHIDRNPLNNQKSNLRVATKSTNAMNSKLRIDNSSGIKGISWRKEKSKWEVYINKNKVRKRLGYFNDIKDAILARINAEKELFGEFINEELLQENLKKL